MSVMTINETTRKARKVHHCGMCNRLYVNDTIGREVASRNELTKDEAGLVIDSLERDLAGAQS